MGTQGTQFISQFILASGNPHKARELTQLFSGGGVEIVPAPEGLSVEESGNSFEQNALLKAQAYVERFQAPTLADDSGLNVPSLPREMGVHSARFGGENLSDRQRAELLLERLQGQTGTMREAHFVCLLCLYFSPEEVFFFEGRLEGVISESCQGEGGFGYDPVFIPQKAPQGESLAQIPQWKRQHGHRARAAQRAQEFLLGRGGA